MTTERVITPVIACNRHEECDVGMTIIVDDDEFIIDHWDINDLTHLLQTDGSVDIVKLEQFTPVVTIWLNRESGKELLVRLQQWLD